MTSDAIRLGEAAARGDEGALAELLASHLPALRAFVRLRTGAAIRTRESSSDLVQRDPGLLCGSPFADVHPHGPEGRCSSDIVEELVDLLDHLRRRAA